jgi:hypothetical protein
LIPLTEKVMCEWYVCSLVSCSFSTIVNL